MSDTPKQPKLVLRPAARIADNKRLKKRGFGSLTTEQRQRIASAGGKASHASGNGHKWNSEEATAAGRIGGRVGRRGPTAKTTE